MIKYLCNAAYNGLKHQGKCLEIMSLSYAYVIYDFTDLPKFFIFLLVANDTSGEIWLKIDFGGWIKIDKE